MTTITRVEPNIHYSVHRWLREVEYDIDGVTAATLLTRFSPLVVESGYPDDLVRLTKPTLAVVVGEATAGAHLIGLAPEEDRFTIQIYGFVVGVGQDANARLYRDRLKNDVYQLFRLVAAEVGIDLYDATSEEVIGSIDVDDDVRARLLPMNALGIEADRYKFVIEATAVYQPAALSEGA